MSDTKKMVIVCEEDEMVRNTIVRILRRRFPDLVVVSSMTTSEALKTFQERDPQSELVITINSYNSGNPHPLTLVRDLRSEGFYGPIVAISGSTEGEMRLIEAGCTQKLSKPFDPKHLESIIGRLLGYDKSPA